MKKWIVIGVVGLLAVELTGCGNPCKNGHTWVNATCVDSKKCSVCDAVGGEPLGHSVAKYITVSEATCKSEGKGEATCKECGEVIEKEISKKEHTEGEWKVLTEPTGNKEGLKSLSCSACGEIIKSETYTLSPEAIRENYKSKCGQYTYDEISRNPDDYTLRVNVTKGTYIWDDTVLVSYTKKDSSEARILDDDIITMYGMLGGTYTYETVLGSSLTVPLFFAEYIEL